MNEKIDAFLELTAHPEVGPHALSPRAAWVWSADGTRLLWTNAAGGAFFGAASVGKALARTFGVETPTARQLATLAAAAEAATPRLERLRFFIGLRALSVMAAVSPIALADGARALLVASAEAVEHEPRRGETADAFADFLANSHAVAAVLDAYGEVIGASGRYEELSDVAADIDQLLTEAEIGPRPLVVRDVLTAEGERRAGVARIADGDETCHVLIVWPAAEKAERTPKAPIEAPAEAATEASAEAPAEPVAVETDVAEPAPAATMAAVAAAATVAGVVVPEAEEPAEPALVADVVADAGLEEYIPAPLVELAGSAGDAADATVATVAPEAEVEAVAETVKTVTTDDEPAMAADVEADGDDADGEDADGEDAEDGDEDVVAFDGATIAEYEAAFDAIEAGWVPGGEGDAPTTGELIATDEPTAAEEPVVADEPLALIEAGEWANEARPDEAGEAGTAQAEPASAEVADSDAVADGGIVPDVAVADIDLLPEGEDDLEEALVTAGLEGEAMAEAAPDEGAGIGLDAEEQAEDLAEEGADAEDLASPQDPDEAVEDDEPVSDFAFEPRPAPDRFVWELDGEGRFQYVSPEFARAVGPAMVDLEGLSWDEVASALILDKDGAVASAIASRDTWSGLDVAWPVENATLRVPVELSGIPVYGSDRQFRGYRGFGLCRTVEAFDDPELASAEMADGEAAFAEADMGDAAEWAASLASETSALLADAAPSGLTGAIAASYDRLEEIAAGEGLSGEMSDDLAVDLFAPAGEVIAPVEPDFAEETTPNAEEGAGEATAETDFEPEFDEWIRPPSCPPETMVGAAAASDAEGEGVKENASGDATGEGEKAEAGTTSRWATASGFAALAGGMAAGVWTGSDDVADAAVTETLETASDTMTETVVVAETAATEVVDEVTNAADEVFQGLGHVEDTGEDIVGLVGENAATAVDYVTGTVETAGDTVAETVVAAETAATEVVDEVADAADEVFQGLGHVEDTGEDIVGLVGETAATAVDYVTETVETAGDTITETAAVAEAAATGVVDEVTDAADEVFQGLGHVEDSGEDIVGLVGEASGELEPVVEAAAAMESVDIPADLPGGIADLAEPLMPAEVSAAPVEEPAVPAEEPAGLVEEPVATLDAPQDEPVVADADDLMPDFLPGTDTAAAEEAVVAFVERAIDDKSPEKFSGAEIVAVPTRGRDSKIVRLRTPRPGELEEAGARLAAHERSAFREIAKALGARLEGDEVLPEDLPPSRPPHVPAKLADAVPEKPATDTPASEPRAAAAATEHPRVASMIDARVLDRLPVGLLVVRGEELLHANRAVLQLLGYPDLAALSKAGGLDNLFVDGPDWKMQSAEGRTPIFACASDGSRLPVDARLMPVNWHGETAAMLMVEERDARAERIEELEAIVSAAIDGVVTLGPNGNIRKLNAQARELLGYAEADVVGLPVIDLFVEESQPAVADYFASLKGDAIAPMIDEGREVSAVSATGRTIPVHLTIATMGGDGGRRLAVLRDITRWKDAERELIESRREAENASAMKSEFLARISHEIRTPLNAIIGFSEVMMAERFGPVGSERYRGYLADINSSGTHLVGLVNDLLDLSKIEAGKLELNFSSVDLNDIVQSCVAIMQPQANRERIIIRTSLPAGVPPVVADQRSMRQIVLNLLTNAIRFTLAGGQVIVSTALEDNGEVVLRVRDTGVGMSEKDIALALEPFRQLTTTPRGSLGGTGLGLPLTKALAEANRATFIIDSAVDQGTLITLTFPAQRVLAE